VELDVSFTGSKREQLDHFVPDVGKKLSAELKRFRDNYIRESWRGANIFDVTSSSYPSLTSAQDRYEKEYERIKRDSEPVSREAQWRRIIAYGFKLLAVGGGMAVTAGVNQVAAQGIGIC
jgi:hypothetical protein